MKKKSTTILPTSSDHLCKFYFIVYKEKDGDRWFVRQNSPACWSHSYHPPRERRYRVDNLNVLPDDTKETAAALLDSLIPASMVNLYIKTTSGLRLLDNPIQHLRKLVLDKKYNLQNESTTAQKLMQILESSKDMHYVTYTGSYDEANRQVRVRKRNSNGKSVTELTNIDKEARDFIICVIQGLSLGNGEFLLAVAWVTSEARHFHSLYPDILGCNARRRTCAWHVIDRNYVKPNKTLCDNDFDYEFLNTVKDWMYSFANDIDTKSEEEYSVRKLVAYLSDDKVTNSVSDKLISSTRSFVNETLKKNLPVMSLRQYMDIVSGWVKDNSFCLETEDFDMVRDDGRLSDADVFRRLRADQSCRHGT